MRNDDEVALLFRSARPSRDHHSPGEYPLGAATGYRRRRTLGFIGGSLTRVGAFGSIQSASHEELLEAASGSAWHSEMRTLLEFMQRNPLRTDRKRLDALLLLEAMQESTPTDPKHASP